MHFVCLFVLVVVCFLFLTLLGLAFGLHLLEAHSVTNMPLLMSAGHALQREISNTHESITCHDHNKVLYH